MKINLTVGSRSLGIDLGERKKFVMPITLNDLVPQGKAMTAEKIVEHLTLNPVRVTVEMESASESYNAMDTMDAIGRPLYIPDDQIQAVWTVADKKRMFTLLSQFVGGIK